MNPQTLMMLQALGGGAPQAHPNVENQIQLMRRLGSPIYANSPLRSPQSPIAPTSNPFNQQAAAAFAPVQQQQRPQ